MDFRKPNGVDKKYQKYQKQHASELKNSNFHDRIVKEDSVVESREHFTVVENLFKYDLWDGYEVKKHLLVVPKQFTETISDFSAEERAEFVEILADYEKKGYSIYARAPQNLRKTVKHQHTHLIVLDYKKPIKFLVNWRKKFLWWK